jgi:hypothetical protein
MSLPEAPMADLQEEYVYLTTTSLCCCRLQRELAYSCHNETDLGEARGTTAEVVLPAYLLRS